MNKCPKCGTKGDVMFCPECGTKMIEESEHTEEVQDVRVCPKCGYEGAYAFCPECGSEMIGEEQRKQEEEKKKSEIYENAVKHFEKKKSESYKQGIAELEGLGDWKDANILAEKYKEELIEIEKIEEEQKAESEKETLYAGALKKFEQKTSKSYKAGIFI